MIRSMYSDPCRSKDELDMSKNIKNLIAVSKSLKQSTARLKNHLDKKYHQDELENRFEVRNSDHKDSSHKDDRSQSIQQP